MMHGRAYPLSYSRNTSQQTGEIFHALGRKVRERFSRDPKPLDHLGGATPEDHAHLKDPLLLQDIDQDLEIWPKDGTTLEDMKISVG